MMRPELLAPAGGPSQLEAALRFGADAVYVGGSRFGLRAYAGNFDADALCRAVDTVHARGKSLHVTMNAYLYNGDLDAFAQDARTLERIGVDAAIVADPAAVEICREVAPQLTLHLSTQANTLNWRAAAFWHRNGVQRVVLARELNMEDVRGIRRNTPETLEIEAFVHGAVCASYSGRCVLSNYLTGRDANQGQCAQTCRWKYALVEEKRPGEYLPVFEDAHGTYFYSANDLCMIAHLRELVDAGVCSFKIEGRMKTDYYVATVVAAYRRAIDDMLEHPDAPFDETLLHEVGNASHRRFGTGFYFTQRPADPPGAVEYDRNADYIAKVLEVGEDGVALVEQKNKFTCGETLQLLSPAGARDFLCERMTDEDGAPIESAPHPKQRVRLPLPTGAQPGDFLRRRVK
ncbi:MAG: U32 family peptidase [Candidatus Spyradocola sp.]|nr:U32 family peptidase [Candidatus Spyradocola sp.]